MQESNKSVGMTIPGAGSSADRTPARRASRRRNWPAATLGKILRALKLGSWAAGSRAKGLARRAFGGAGPEIVEMQGVRVEIDPAVMSEKMQALIRAGNLSYQEARGVGSIIAKGERFLELGGGIGYTSSIVAKQNKAESITVVEANPQLIPLMRKTHAMNGVEATIVNAIVLPRKETDTVTFHVTEDFNASSLMQHKTKVTRAVEVPVMLFDDLRRACSPTMLMIDVEGGELAVLDGANLQGIKKIYVELHKWKIGERGIKKIFDILSAKGFAYDPKHSRGTVVLFRRCRPLAGAAGSQPAKAVS